MPRKHFFLPCLLFLVAFNGSGAQAVVLQGTAGDWSARSSTGLTLTGTWTAAPGPTSGTVIGTWTLVDAQGRTVAGGGWSASKSPAGWTGSWRAVIYDRKPEYTGTWNAGVDLKRNARFADLFEKAVQTVVSGNWRAGGHSGPWSIRAQAAGRTSPDTAPPPVTSPITRPVPPTRDPNTPGFVTAKELPDGSVPPTDADGNFVIGATHTPAFEMVVHEGVPRGAVHTFTMSSADSKIFPGIARDAVKQLLGA